MTLGAASVKRKTYRKLVLVSTREAIDLFAILEDHEGRHGSNANFLK